MLSVAQERKSSFKQIVSLISLLIFAVFGFLFFSSLHPVNAQGSLNPSCAGQDKVELTAIECDGQKDAE